MKGIVINGSKTMGIQKLKRRFNLKKIFRALSVVFSLILQMALTGKDSGWAFLL